MFSECPRRAGGDRTGSVLTASSAEGIGNASPSPDWARNWDHPKCIIYEFSYLFMYCRTFPCVSSAFSLRSQRILKHNSDSVWSRWFWSFYFKIISLCFTVKMISQPVWSVHVLLIQQHGCWPRDIREEGVLWRSSHLFFPGEGRGCSSARNTSRAEGIPGITPSVLWFPPFHPPLWGCQDHLPSSQTCTGICIWSLCGAFPGPCSVNTAHSGVGEAAKLRIIRWIQGGEEDLLLLWGVTVIIWQWHRKGALRHQGKLKMCLIIVFIGDSKPTLGFEWPFSLSHWAVLQLLLSLVSARIPKFSKHQLIGRIWRRKLYFSTGELGFCGNLQVIWCWLQVCKEDPEGEGVRLREVEMLKARGHLWFPNISGHSTA